MKITEIVVELKQGLPNYSSRAVTVRAVADVNESLGIEQTVNALTAQVQLAWFPERKEAVVEKKAEEKKEAPPKTEKKQQKKVADLIENDILKDL